MTHSLVLLVVGKRPLRCGPLPRTLTSRGAGGGRGVKVRQQGSILLLFLYTVWLYLSGSDSVRHREAGDTQRGVEQSVARLCS